VGEREKRMLLMFVNMMNWKRERNLLLFIDSIVIVIAQPSSKAAAFHHVPFIQHLDMSYLNVQLLTSLHFVLLLSSA